MKKLLCTILALGAMFMLTGCGAEKSVDKFVNEYYAGWEDGKINAEISYDNYISATSKELLRIDRDQYIKNLNDMLTKNGLLYKSINIKKKGITPYNDYIYKVVGIVKAESFGQSASIPVTDYVINENGEYKFLQYGVNGKELAETNFNSESFGISMDVMYTGPEVLMINIVAKNPTTSNYSIGYNSDAKLVVETDQGTYEKIIPGTNIVKARDNNQGTELIENVKGTVNKITLYNVYELTPTNELKDKSNARSFVLYERK